MWLLGSVITYPALRSPCDCRKQCVYLSFESSGVVFSVFTERWVVTWLGARVADVSDTMVSAPVC